MGNIGTVSAHIQSLIAKQIGEHGIVVWYDPERHYQELAPGLDLPGARNVCYRDSFYALRAQIDGQLDGTEPPALLVYVPLAQADCHQALAELEAAGVVMKPGKQPPACNTRLTVVARGALKPLLGDDVMAAIEKQVDAAKLTLADLDRLAGEGEAVGKGLISLIFGTGNPREVALSFLTSDSREAEIAAKDAGPELASMLRATVGLDLPADESLAAWRARLARYVLVTDLVAGTKAGAAGPLATVKVAAATGEREACIALASNWRLRRDLRDGYIVQANQVEKQLDVAHLGLALEQIAGAETFAGLEVALQRLVEQALLVDATEDLIEIARARQSTFWAEAVPGIQARWALIAMAGQVLRDAGRIEQALKSSTATVAGLFQAYASRDEPWCTLDTYHRHMERRAHNFDFDLSGQHETLEQLIAKGRERYMEVGGRLAERFVREYKAAQFQVPDSHRQAEIFQRHVKPALSHGKLAYVWVDALRYEMARELAQTVLEDFHVDIEPCLGTVPTITEIGMAALLPGAQDHPALVQAGESKLALQLGSTTIRDRKERLAYLKAQAGIGVYDARLDDLLPNPKKKIREGIQGAGLVLITSQEIDALAEGDNIPLARRTMDEILHELRRAFRVLTELGAKTIVVAADHGYLFGDELGVEMKLDPPGGDTADLHRRVWVGHGGAADEAYLRATAQDFGLGGDLEIAVPWGFACFKVKGGASAYFHGGLSPQEVVVPVLTLTSKKPAAEKVGGDIAWTFTPGSNKISTRFFSVQVAGAAAGLLGVTPPKVRVEIHAKGECISIPVSASYGFQDATGDVQLRLGEKEPGSLEPNTITLMITKEPSQKTVTVRLLNATSGAELAHFEIEMAISI